MRTSFPTVPDRYNQGWFNQLVQALGRYFNACVSQNEETPRIIMRSPNGTSYQVNVSDIGRIYTSPVDAPTSPILLAIVFSARMTVGQTIPTAAGAPTYQAPIDNVGNYFNQATGHFAPPTGVYQVSASVGAASTGPNADLFIALYKNGVEVARGGSSASASGISISANVGGSVLLNVGDYVEVRIWGDRVGSTDAVSCAFSGQGQVTQ